MTVEIRNRGEMCLTSGGADDYSLERYRDGDWEAVPLKGDYATLPVRHSFRAGSDTEQEIKWAGPYGPLPEGTYRVVKSFAEEGARQNCCRLAAEFTIEG